MSRTPALICLMGPNDMVFTRDAGGDLGAAPQPRRPRDAAAIVLAVAPRKWRRGWLMSSCSFMVSSQLAQRLEGGAELAGEQLRLLPCCEVTAPVDDVEVDQLVIGALGPALRRAIDLAGEHRDRGRQRNVDGVEVVGVVLPVQARARGRRVGQPVQRDVVEDLVAGERALRVATAVRPRGELVVEPGGEPDRRVGEAVAQ